MQVRVLSPVPENKLDSLECTCYTPSMFKDGKTRRQYDRDYFARMPPKQRQRKQLKQRERRTLILAWVTEQKRQGCSSCPERDPVCIDFHHPGGDKEINIGDATRQGWSVARLKKEIAKCVLLCANCHRKRHSRV